MRNLAFFGLLFLLICPALGAEDNCPGFISAVKGKAIEDLFADFPNDLDRAALPAGVGRCAGGLDQKAAAVRGQ